MSYDSKLITAKSEHDTNMGSKSGYWFVVAKIIPQIQRHETMKVCFLLLLQVHWALAGDFALLYPQSGTNIDLEHWISSWYRDRKHDKWDAREHMLTLKASTWKWHILHVTDESWSCGTPNFRLVMKFKTSIYSERERTRLLGNLNDYPMLSCFWS